MSKNHILIAQRKVSNTIVGKGVGSDHLISTGKHACETEVLIAERLLFSCRGNLWIFLSVTGRFGCSEGVEHQWLFVREGGEKYV